MYVLACLDPMRGSVWFSRYHLYVGLCEEPGRQDCEKLASWCQLVAWTGLPRPLLASRLTRDRPSVICPGCNYHVEKIKGWHSGKSALSR